MQNNPSSSPTWTYLRFNVWGLSIASAVTVFFAGLIKMVFHLMHRAEYHLSGVPGAPTSTEAMTHYSSLGAWHFFGPLIHGVLAGVAAAIFAAVYNAVSFRRTSQT